MIPNRWPIPTPRMATQIAFNKADQAFTDWLYGEYDEQKLTQFELLHNVPVLGQYMDYKLDLRRDQEYMARHQLSYSDIHDPRKLSETSSGSALYGSTLRMVSKNIDKLYE